MKFNTKSAVIIFCAAAVIGLGVYYFLSRVPFEQQKPAVGETAPAITLSDMSGNMVNLSDFRGRVVLVNFWASWCPPCKAEMPGFQRVFQDLEPKDFIVLAVVLDDIQPQLLRELGITFPVMKINERVKRAYGGISDVPQSILIDREGRIIKKVWKTYHESDLKADVQRILKKQ